MNWYSSLPWQLQVLASLQAVSLVVALVKIGHGIGQRWTLGVSLYLLVWDTVEGALLLSSRTPWSWQHVTFGLLIAFSLGICLMKFNSGDPVSKNANRDALKRPALTVFTAVLMCAGMVYLVAN